MTDSIQFLLDQVHETKSKTISMYKHEMMIMHTYYVYYGGVVSDCELTAECNLFHRRLHSAAFPGKTQIGHTMSTKNTFSLLETDRSSTD